MAIRGAEYAVARIIATLQAYLPTELNTIDTEESDGLTLDDVANANYYIGEVEDQHTPEYPAIVVEARSSRPISIVSTSHSPGSEQAEHEIAVTVLMNNSNNESKANLCKRVWRYARAVIRVLAIRYPTLPSGTTPTEVAVRWEDPAIYKGTDETGVYIRSAEIPLIVQSYENL